MVLPFGGTISLEHIINEFGGNSPHGLHEYYRNGSAAGTYVPTNASTMRIPTGSAGTPISLFDFYGAGVLPSAIPATIYMTGYPSNRFLTSESRGATKTYYFGKDVASTGGIPWSTHMDAYHGSTWGFYALSAGGGGSQCSSKSSTGPVFGGSGGGGGSCLMVTHGMPFDKNRQYKIEIGPPGHGGGSRHNNYNDLDGGDGGDIIISTSSGVTGDDHVDNIIARVNGGTGGKAYYNGNTFISQGGTGGTISVQPNNQFIGIGGDGGVGKTEALSSTAAGFGGGGGGAGGFDATGVNQANGGDGGTNGGDGSQGNFGGAGGGASDATFNSVGTKSFTWYTDQNRNYNSAGGYNSGGSSILPLYTAFGQAWRRVVYDGTHAPFVDPFPPHWYQLYSNNNPNGFWNKSAGVQYGNIVDGFPPSSNTQINAASNAAAGGIPMLSYGLIGPNSPAVQFENSSKYRHYRKQSSDRNYPANWFSKFFLTGQFSNNNLNPLTSGRDSRGAAGTNTDRFAMGGGGVYGGFSGTDHREYYVHGTGVSPFHPGTDGRFNAFGVGGGAPSNYYLTQGSKISIDAPGMPGGPAMVVIWFSTNSTGTGGFKKLPYNEGSPI